MIYNPFLTKETRWDLRIFQKVLWIIKFVSKLLLKSPDICDFKEETINLICFSNPDFTLTGLLSIFQTIHSDQELSLRKLSDSNGTTFYC